MHWKNLVKMLSIKCLQLYFMSVYVFWCGAALTKTLGRIKWIEWIEWCMNSVNMFATAFSPHYKRLVFRLSEWFPSGRSMCMSCLQVFVNSCSNCAGCIFFGLHIMRVLYVKQVQNLYGCVHLLMMCQACNLPTYLIIELFCFSFNSAAIFNSITWIKYCFRMKIYEIT